MSFAGATLAVVFATLAPQAERVEQPRRVPAGKVVVSGTVVARDAEGVAHREEDGTLELAQSFDDRQVIDVRDGRWEALLDERRGFGLVAITLGGRSLDLDSLEEFEPPYDRPIAIDAAWIHEIMLHVVAAGSGEKLTGVEVVEARRGDGDRRFPTERSSDRIVTNAARSPIAMSRLGTFWVRAMGRAWTWLDLTAPDSRDVTIELAEACALEVATRGVDPGREVTLQVDVWNEEDGYEHSSAIRQRVPEDGRIELTDLPPCRARVSAGLDFGDGCWWFHFLTLGEAVATLAPAAPARVTLDLTAVPQGLDGDGTVERTVRVVRTGPNGSEPFDGDGAVTFLFASPAPMEIRESSRRRTKLPFGRILFKKADGDELARSPQTFEIRDGAFRLRVPCGASMFVRGLTLDGREFVIEENLPLEKLVRIDSNAEPLLLPWPADALAVGDPLPFTLHVVDAATKQELPRARVAFSHRSRENERLHPGAVPLEDRLVDSMTSPLHPPTPKKRIPRYAWAGADGYTWSLFDFRDHASATVEVTPGADLEVEIENASLPAGTKLEIWKIPARDEFDAEIERQTAAWRAAADRAPRPPGAPTIEEYLKPLRDRYDYFASWWSGSIELPAAVPSDRVVDFPIDEARRFDLPGVPRAFLIVGLTTGGQECFAFAPIDARRGGRHVVRVTASESLLPVSARMKGTLFIPPEWGSARPALTLEPENVPFLADQSTIELDGADLHAIEATPGLYAWETAALQTGTWSFHLEKFGFSHRVELGPEGRDDVALVVPPPAELRVNAVDAESGEPIALSDLVFALRTPDSVAMNQYSLENVDRNQAVDRLTVRVPVGEIDLRVDPADYAPVEVATTVTAAGQAITLRCHRDLGIKIRWQVDGKPQKKKHMVSVNVDDAEGRDVMLRYDWFEGGIVIQLTRPGRHRVTFWRVRGYQPIPPVEVDTRAGEYVEVPVELVPEERR